MSVHLRNDIPQVDLSPVHSINCNMPNSLFLFPVTMSECTSITAGLKASGAGPYAIPVRIVIHTMHMLAGPISYLINKFFEFETFPNILKLVTITPIYKSNDSKKVFNYRPTSILHWLNKALKGPWQCE